MCCCCRISFMEIAVSGEWSWVWNFIVLTWFDCMVCVFVAPPPRSLIVLGPVMLIMWKEHRDRNEDRGPWSWGGHAHVLTVEPETPHVCWFPLIGVLCPARGLVWAVVSIDLSGVKCVSWDGSAQLSCSQNCQAASLLLWRVCGCRVTVCCDLPCALVSEGGVTLLHRSNVLYCWFFKKSCKRDWAGKHLFRGL